MALAGKIGIMIEMGHCFDPAAAQLFGEDQARYLVSTGEPEEFDKAAALAGIQTCYFGTVRGNAVEDDWDNADRQFSIPLATLRAAHEGFFPALMDGEL